MNNNELGAKLAKETLTGDIAAFLIDRLKHLPKTYQEMSENEQREQIEMAKTAAKNLVSQAVKIVSGAGRKTVQAKLDSVTIKDGCKVVLKGSGSIASELANIIDETVLIVTNNDTEFTGGEDALQADSDQRDIFNNCGSEYRDADGEGISDPQPDEKLGLPAPEPEIEGEYADFEEIKEEGDENQFSDEDDQAAE